MTSCRIYVRSDQKINVILNFFKKYLFINSYLVPFNAAPVTNFKVVFLIDRTTLWQEFMMHHAIAIEENSEKNLYIWQNLMCFFRSWLFCTFPLEWLGFGFNIIPIHPWFITSYDLFEQICIVVKRCQHLLSDVHATLFLLKIYQFWNNLSCRTFHVWNISRNCLAWAERYANIIIHIYRHNWPLQPFS